jgi:tRNA-intron endonuclease, archaea type
VYERGPGIDHAPYLVQVYKPGFDITATAIVLAGRLATTVKKQFIIAIPKTNEREVEFIGFDWWRA